MGYTHYWRRTRAFTDQEWTLLTEYSRRIVNAALCEKIELSNWKGDSATDPDIDREKISLNGTEDESCETFHLTKCLDKLFDFCKTRQRPYDPVVVTILHAAATLAPDAILVSSDGDLEDGAGMFHFTDRVDPPKSRA
jgi:hypothetical protein